jgi:hypothetical protein
LTKVTELSKSFTESSLGFKTGEVT